jgi:hypothetical protein
MTQTDNTARLVALALTGILFATASTFAGASFAEAGGPTTSAKVERVPALELCPSPRKDAGYPHPDRLRRKPRACSTRRH